MQKLHVQQQQQQRDDKEQAWQLKWTTAAKEVSEKDFPFTTQSHLHLLQFNLPTRARVSNINQSQKCTKVIANAVAVAAGAKAALLLLLLLLPFCCRCFVWWRQLPREGGRWFWYAHRTHRVLFINQKFILLFHMVLKDLRFYVVALYFCCYWHVSNEFAAAATTWNYRCLFRSVSNVTFSFICLFLLVGNFNFATQCLLLP